MTGRRDQPFNWLHDVGLPAVWGAAEATWASLAIGAIVNNGDASARTSLPYPAFAVPVVVAAVTSGLISRLGWSAWRRWALQAAVVVVGGAVTAGLIAGLSVPGSVWRALAVPWTVRGAAAATAVAAGWWVAAVCWARGVWLGSQQAGFVHIVRSAGVGAAAFVLILLARAGHGQPAFNSATRPAGVLFVLFVCGTATTVALVRESDLEREILLRPAPGASVAWLAVLAVPVAALAALVILVAFVAGPVAPVIGRAVLHAGRDVWTGVTAAAGAVAGLFPSHRASPTPARRAPAPVAGHPLDLSHSPLAWLAVAAAVVGLVSIIWSARRFRPSIGPRLRLPRFKPAAAPGAVGPRSTFGRPHPLRALRGAWQRALARLRGGQGEVDRAPAVVAGAERPPVRREYRQVLAAAAGHDLGRRPAETAHELERRLAPRVGGAGAQLHQLTALYAEVRYGGRSAGVDEGDAAALAAAEVIAGLEGGGDPGGAGPSVAVRAPR